MRGERRGVFLFGRLVSSLSRAKPDLRPFPSHIHSFSPSPSPLTSQFRIRTLTHEPICLSGLIRTGLVSGRTR
uniref:Uncharacterized protein n=1 Tax=Brassica oleracea TaxID=3712 RepID=A0A3P6F548_BRAOL|nr:unnamed protein product [Brassica oleracea]